MGESPQSLPQAEPMPMFGPGVGEVESGDPMHEALGTPAENPLVLQMAGTILQKIEDGSIFDRERAIDSARRKDGVPDRPSRFVGRVPQPRTQLSGKRVD